jgi:hypothetical protein
MQRTTIQTLSGKAVAFPGDLCLQVHAPRPVGSWSHDEVKQAP